MSSSSVDSGKTVSTGFNFTAYNNLEQLAMAMHTKAHCPSVFSEMVRFDPYSGKFIKQKRRRKHNLSLIGNILCYDFDNGSLSFNDAAILAESFELPTLLIRSKSDHLYHYDRFKMAIVTDFLYPVYHSDPVPDGFQKMKIDDYLSIYYGFAKRNGFFNHMDTSTKDYTRLIARVTNEENEVREFKIIGGYDA